ncbi:MAG: PAS domain S-box-containing protein [Candidatus Latescibacterota bacterium]|jgi:PAS domain S-box-containing protein
MTTQPIVESHSGETPMVHTTGVAKYWTKERMRLALLLLVLIGTTTIVSTTTIALLYRAAFAEQERALIELVGFSANFIESIGEFDKQYSVSDVPGGSLAATLSQVQQALEDHTHTSKFAVATLRGEEIFFLLHSHKKLTAAYDTVPLDSPRAKPMRLALAGHTGTTVAQDYQGTPVLAAYTPIPSLAIGLVAKIDIADIRAPFLLAVGWTAVVTVLVIALGILCLLHLELPFIERLTQSEQRYRDLVENAQDGVWSIDANSHTTFVNPRMAEILGYETKEMIGRPLFSFMDAQGVLLAQKNVARRKEGITENHEFELIARDGQRVYTAMGTAPELDSSGTYSGATAWVTDITARKRAEQRVEKALQEKETLLKEIHHRVKNNLQLIASLLSMQARRIDEDTDIAQIMADSQNRVHSMALLHERLYSSNMLDRIDLGSYISTLSEDLISAYGLDHSTVQVKTEIDSIFIDIDTAVPCCLIVNELVTNALKHAFTPDVKGCIHIGCQQLKGHCTLQVKDDGKGLSPDHNLDDIQTLGLHLVQILTGQLQGTWGIESTAEGTSVSIRFPISSAPEV